MKKGRLMSDSGNKKPTLAALAAPALMAAALGAGLTLAHGDSVSKIALTGAIAGGAALLAVVLVRLIFPRH